MGKFKSTAVPRSSVETLRRGRFAMLDRRDMHGLRAACQTGQTEDYM